MLNKSQTWDSGKMSKRSRQSAVSFILGFFLHLRQESLHGSQTPGTVPPLCPQDLLSQVSLNGLDFCSGNIIQVFKTTCSRLFLAFGGHCGMWHSHHLVKANCVLSDHSLWVTSCGFGVWCPFTDHSFPAIFSKRILTTSTMVRHLPIRKQVGCRLPGREDPYGSHFYHGWGHNLLLSDTDNEPVTSVWGEW